MWKWNFMTEQQREQQAIDFNVRIGFDPTGDPILRIDMSEEMAPDSTMGPEQVRELGLLLISSAVKAEAAAQMRRQMLLDGAPPDIVEAVTAFMM